VVLVSEDADDVVLLFLTGGPGQPGVPFVQRIAYRIAPALKDYRLVMFDQRGTGQFGAINCPALQTAVGRWQLPARALRPWLTKARRR